MRFFTTFFVGLAVAALFVRFACPRPVPATGVEASADAIREFPHNKADCAELAPNARLVELEECSLELSARRHAEV